jgi:multicomponent Na+:H+ antiporter subunit A
MVETLFVVLVAIVLLRLPGFAGQAHPGRLGSLRDAAIAIGAGLVVALVTIGVALTPIDLDIPAFYEANSFTEAYGRNIVNVILVDFRALDTLGEIAVVATAALAIVALLKVRPHKRTVGDAG